MYGLSQMGGKIDPPTLPHPGGRETVQIHFGLYSTEEEVERNK